LSLGFGGGTQIRWKRRRGRRHRTGWWISVGVAQRSRFGTVGDLLPVAIEMGGGEGTGSRWWCGEGIALAADDWQVELEEAGEERCGKGEGGAARRRRNRGLVWRRGKERIEEDERWRATF
jgi:hypothetical protein